MFSIARVQWALHGMTRTERTNCFEVIDSIGGGPTGGRAVDV